MDPQIPEIEEVPSILLPCTSCNRTFRPEALAKHSKVCEKTLMKKRKTFDSSKQRLQGTEVEIFPSPPSATSVKKSRGKEKVDLAKVIHAAKKPEPPTPVRPSDHDECPHCGRFFGPKAFERHTQFCKEQQLKLKSTPTNQEAKERLKVRTSYKGPLTNKVLNRDRYQPKRDPSPMSTELKDDGHKSRGLTRNSSLRSSVRTRGSDSTPPPPLRRTMTQINANSRPLRRSKDSVDESTLPHTNGQKQGMPRLVTREPPDKKLKTQNKNFVSSPKKTVFKAKDRNSLRSIENTRRKCLKSGGSQQTFGIVNLSDFTELEKSFLLSPNENEDVVTENVESNVEGGDSFVPWLDKKTGKASKFPVLQCPRPAKIPKIDQICIENYNRKIPNSQSKDDIEFQPHSNVNPSNYTLLPNIVCLQNEPLSFHPTDEDIYNIDAQNAVISELMSSLDESIGNKLDSGADMSFYQTIDVNLLVCSMDLSNNYQKCCKDPIGKSDSSSPKTIDNILTRVGDCANGNGGMINPRDKCLQPLSSDMFLKIDKTQDQNTSLENSSNDCLNNSMLYSVLSKKFKANKRANTDFKRSSSISSLDKSFDLSYLKKMNNNLAQEVKQKFIKNVCSNIFLEIKKSKDQNLNSEICSSNCSNEQFSNNSLLKDKKISGDKQYTLKLDCNMPPSPGGETFQTFQSNNFLNPRKAIYDEYITGMNIFEQSRHEVPVIPSGKQSSKHLVNNDILKSRISPLEDSLNISDTIKKLDTNSTEGKLKPKTSFLDLGFTEYNSLSKDHDSFQGNLYEAKNIIPYESTNNNINQFHKVSMNKNIYEDHRIPLDQDTVIQVRPNIDESSNISKTLKYPEIKTNISQMSPIVPEHSMYYTFGCNSPKKEENKKSNLSEMDGSCFGGATFVKYFPKTVVPLITRDVNNLHDYNRLDLELSSAPKRNHALQDKIEVRSDSCQPTNITVNDSFTPQFSQQTTHLRMCPLDKEESVSPVNQPECANTKTMENSTYICVDSSAPLSSIDNENQLSLGKNDCTSSGAVKHNMTKSSSKWSYMDSESNLRNNNDFNNLPRFPALFHFNENYLKYNENQARCSKDISVPLKNCNKLPNSCKLNYKETSNDVKNNINKKRDNMPKILRASKKHRRRVKNNIARYENVTHANKESHTTLKDTTHSNLPKLSSKFGCIASVNVFADIKTQTKGNSCDLSSNSTLLKDDVNKNYFRHNENLADDKDNHACPKEMNSDISKSSTKSYIADNDKFKENKLHFGNKSCSEFLSSDTLHNKINVHHHTNNENSVKHIYVSPSEGCINSYSVNTRLGDFQESTKRGENSKKFENTQNENHTLGCEFIHSSRDTVNNTLPNFIFIEPSNRSMYNKLQSDKNREDLSFSQTSLSYIVDKNDITYDENATQGYLPTFSMKLSCVEDKDDNKSIQNSPMCNRLSDFPTLPRRAFIDNCSATHNKSEGIKDTQTFSRSMALDELPHSRLSLNNNLSNIEYNQNQIHSNKEFTRTSNSPTSSLILTPNNTKNIYNVGNMQCNIEKFGASSKVSTPNHISDYSEGHLNEMQGTQEIQNLCEYTYIHSDHHSLTNQNKNMNQVMIGTKCIGKDIPLPFRFIMNDGEHNSSKKLSNNDENEDFENKKQDDNRDICNFSRVAMQCDPLDTPVVSHSITDKRIVSYKELNAPTKNLYHNCSNRKISRRWSLFDFRNEKNTLNSVEQTISDVVSLQRDFAKRSSQIACCHRDVSLKWNLYIKSLRFKMSFPVLDIVIIKTGELVIENPTICNLKKIEILGISGNLDENIKKTEDSEVSDSGIQHDNENFKPNNDLSSITKVGIAVEHSENFSSSQENGLTDIELINPPENSQETNRLFNISSEVESLLFDLGNMTEKDDSSNTIGFYNQLFNLDTNNIYDAFEFMFPDKNNNELRDSHLREDCNKFFQNENELEENSVELKKSCSVYNIPHVDLEKISEDSLEYEETGIQKCFDDESICSDSLKETPIIKSPILFWNDHKLCNPEDNFAHEDKFDPSFCIDLLDSKFCGSQTYEQNKLNSTDVQRGNEYRFQNDTNETSTNYSYSEHSTRTNSEFHHGHTENYFEKSIKLPPISIYTKTSKTEEVMMKDGSSKKIKNIFKNSQIIEENFCAIGFWDCSSSTNTSSPINDFENENTTLCLKQCSKTLEYFQDDNECHTVKTSVYKIENTAENLFESPQYSSRLYPQHSSCKYSNTYRDNKLSNRDKLPPIFTKKIPQKKLSRTLSSPLNYFEENCKNENLNLYSSYGDKVKNYEDEKNSVYSNSCFKNNSTPRILPFKKNEYNFNSDQSQYGDRITASENILIKSKPTNHDRNYQKPLDIHLSCSTVSLPKITTTLDMSCPNSVQSARNKSYAKLPPIRPPSSFPPINLRNNHRDAEKYNPYLSAERQMMELFGGEASNKSPTILPEIPSSPLQSSPTSAFVKYRSSSIENLKEQDNNNPGQVEASSGLRKPDNLSLSNLSLCSVVSIDSVDCNRNQTRLDEFQRSFSAADAKPRVGRSKVNMREMLYGGNGEPPGNLEACEAELLISMMEFEKMLKSSPSPSPHSSPTLCSSNAPDNDSKQNNNETENQKNLKNLHQGSVDSAYSRSSAGDGDLSQPELPSFCHECGAKYPVAAAKFCCNCGMKRIIL